MTDGEQRATLALVRSLGRAGYQVHVTSQRGRSLAGASRYCRSDTPVSDPLSDPGRFSRETNELCRRLGIELLLPVTEASMLAVLAESGAAFPPIPFPDLARFAAICDKERVLQVARATGIAIPQQLVLRTRAERSMHDLARLDFPIVIKPARSVSADGDRRIKLGVVHAANHEELVAALDRIPDAGYPLLLQQRINGPGIGVFLLLWEGRLIGQFSHRRIREKPPGGGVSVYRESVAPDPALIERSKKLLEQFGWSGVAMIEYKMDDQTGTPYLMEINGRFWGSLQLAIDAGVDFPRLLAELALGGNPDPVHRYQTGVRSRWWWGDVDHLVARLRRSSAELGMPPGSPGRIRAVIDFLKLWRPGDRNEILRLTDPAPFARETFLWMKGR